MDPSSFTDEQVEALLAQISQYQLAHGSLLSAPLLTETLDCPVPIARPVGVSVFPTPFPGKLFRHALALQEPMNELYIRVAADPEWLGKVLTELRKHDAFVAKLWSIWERVRDEGEVQKLECGVWRSDYMLHAPGAAQAMEDPSPSESVIDPSKAEEAALKAELKQVEFNTYSCAGGAHANIVADMHSYLAARRLHMSTGPPISTPALPRNKTISGIVRAIQLAHKKYGAPVRGWRTAVLMTVQRVNSNTCDERPIEHGLWRGSPPISLHRVEFSDQVLAHCRLGPDRELVYQPPWESEPVEISVVYHRAGYDADEYDERGVDARLLIERSRAIKCPSILGHLAGLKKVQQALAEPDVLERFVEPKLAGRIRSTFMRLHAMDETEDGLAGRALALEERSAEGYILKPSLDGGGHNIHGLAIPPFLRRTPEEEWANYILMEKIIPPPLSNALISYQDLYYGRVISELGVFGAGLWQRQEGDQPPVILANTEIGWSFKTKPADVDEMSVVKGYGCFDCPRLFGESQRFLDMLKFGHDEEEARSLEECRMSE